MQIPHAIYNIGHMSVYTIYHANHFSIEQNVYICIYIQMTPKSHSQGIIDLSAVICLVLSYSYAKEISHAPQIDLIVNTD